MVSPGFSLTDDWLRSTPKQFEQDLKLKALNRMEALKDANPLYQGAYDELRKAIDFLGRGTTPKP